MKSLKALACVSVHFIFENCSKDIALETQRYITITWNFAEKNNKKQQQENHNLAMLKCRCVILAEPHCPIVVNICKKSY